MWFAPFEEPEPLTTADQQRQAEQYDGFLGRLVETGCPRLYASTGTDPWGDAFTTGDDVHPRVVEACLDRQIVLLTPIVSASLDALYDRLRSVELEAGREETVLSQALLDYHGSWLSASDSRCEYEAAQYLGGTGANYAWLSCNAEALTEHQAWVQNEIEQYSLR